MFLDITDEQLRKLYNILNNQAYIAHGDYSSSAVEEKFLLMFEEVRELFPNIEPPECDLTPRNESDDFYRGMVAMLAIVIDSTITKSNYYREIGYNKESQMTEATALELALVGAHFPINLESDFFADLKDLGEV